MATNIKSTTIASSYDRLVLIEDGATISSGTSTVNVEIQTPSGVATATPLHISTDRIGIGVDAPTELLHLKSSTSAKPVLRIENAHTDALPPYINLVKSTTDRADDDFLGVIGFKGQNDNNEEIEYAFISAQSTDVSDGTEDGVINFGTMKNAGGAGSSASINMVLNGSNVGIGTTSPYALLELSSTSDADYSATAKTDAQLQGGTTLGLVNTNTDDENYAQILFRLNQTNTAIARIVAISESNNNVDLAFVSEGSDNATEKLRIKANGKVGIGTPAPDAELDMGGSAQGRSICWGGTSGSNNYAAIGTTYSSGDLVLLAGAKPSTSANKLVYSFSGTYPVSGMGFDRSTGDIGFISEASASHTKDADFDTNAAMADRTDLKMIILNNGNVGIGASSPVQELEVVGDIAVMRTSVSATRYVGITQSSGDMTNSTASIGFISDGTDQQISFSTHNSGSSSGERMRIDEDGKVGIGTNNPDKLLHISSSGTAELHIDGGANAYLLLDASSDSDDSKVIFQKNGTSIGSIDYDHNSTETSAVMKFNLNIAGSEDPQMVIKASGAVGIGTDNPGYRLEVKGAADDAYVALFDNVGTGATAHGIQIKCGDSDHSNDSSTHYIQFLESDGGVVGEIDNSGGSGALALVTASDERLKENIKDSSIDGIALINSIKMREFNWKKRYDKKVEKCGVIAQEVMEVLPSVVSEMGDKDKTLSVAQTGFIYTLIKAVQELSAKVTALESA